MKVPTYSVEYVDENNITQSIHCNSIRSNYSIGTTKDTFDVRLPYYGNYNFKLDEKIRIYMGYTGSNNLVMDGIITSVGNTVESGQDSWILKGNDVLEVFLNHQVPARYESQSAAYMINNILEQAADGQPASRQITLSTQSVTTSATTSTNYYSEYKPVFQHIETISRDAYTNDGDYIYYLDTGNKELIWKPKPVASIGSINMSSNRASIKRTKNEADVVNFIFMNVGRDLDDNTITTYATNIPSISKIGYRTKYEVRSEIANTLKLSDITDNSIFRQTAIDIGKAWGKKILDNFDEGTDKFEMLLQGDTGYLPGQRYDIVLDQTGYNTQSPKQAYLEEVEYTFDKNGFWTILRFNEELK